MSQMPHLDAPTALLYLAEPAGGPEWLWAGAADGVVEARALDEVMPALREVEAAARRGYTALGFLSYDAAPACDAALAAHPPGPLPLCRFGLYRQVRRVAQLPPPPAEAPVIAAWTPTCTAEDYRVAVGRIRDYIARGDTYQVNFTHRLHARFAGDPWVFFLRLARAQCPAYAAWLDLGDDVICSASPELFVARRGAMLTCRPMKGTAPRGLTAAADDARAAWLHASEKNRAENVMIVDMIRHDLGRVARTGSVQVAQLFAVERYDTLWQLTSTVTAESGVGLPELMAALFPCASITGAPKVRTTQIIAELEDSPRGLYTGAIGAVLPGGDLQFNVAIRTAHLDRRTGTLTYGTGGGVTWDSTAADEYEESLLKTRVLTAVRPDFALLETLRWGPGEGYWLLDRHVRRMGESARYFGFPLDPAAVVQCLEGAAADFPPEPRRVRLRAAADGGLTVEHAPLPARPAARWRVALAVEPIDPDDRFLYHKTTHRAVYERARASRPGYDDVLLWNPRGELTESTIANLVVRRRGRWLTPPVASGLLPGTYRAELLARGRIREAVLTPADLARAEAVYLVNSLRGWMRAEFTGCISG